MRRGQGRRRPLALCHALAMLDQRFWRADLFLFYRALLDQPAPGVSRQHATWYRTVGLYIKEGRKWMKTDPEWKKLRVLTKQPPLRAQTEPHPDEWERYYHNARMPMFDGSAARPFTMSPGFLAVLAQSSEIQRLGARFLRALDRPERAPQGHAPGRQGAGRPQLGTQAPMMASR